MPSHLTAIFAQLSFQPPEWPALLAALGLALLGMEAAILIRGLLRLRPPGPAIALAAGGLLAGPVLAAGGGLLRVMAADPAGRPAGTLALRTGLHGSAIVLLGVLVGVAPALGGCLAIAASAAAWAIRSYGRTTAPVSAATRRKLLALRLAALGLLTLWVIEPIWQTTWARDLRGTVLIGVDVSRSMQLADEGSDDARRPRIDAVRTALAASRRPLDDLNRQADVKFFTFSEDASAPRSLPADPAPAIPAAEGPATAIGAATRQAVRNLRAGGANLRAVVLISDGCDNLQDSVSPQTLAARLAGLDVPLHTVRVGRTNAAGDIQALSVASLGVPATLGAFTRMTIEPTVEAIGLEGQAVRVTCRFGEELVGEETFTPTAAQARRTLRFEYVPLDAGFHRLSVQAELVGEAPPALAGVPSRDQRVQVVDRDIRVLYIEGRFRYETKYISNAIGTFDRVSLHRHVLLQPLRENPQLGNALDDWLRYHAIILGDVSPEFFTPEQLQNLRTLVKDYGKGLAMIGGQQAFGAGGWASTPLADVLPVAIDADDGQIDQPVSPQPTAAGETSPLMQIGEASAPLAPWSQLDPLPGASDIGWPKPASQVLAEAGGKAMIVAGQFGKGPTLAIAFDTTWRWVLSPKDTAEAQKRFWRQVVLHLAQPRGHVWIRADRGTYDLRSLRKGLQDVVVAAGVSDSRGQPIYDAAPQVTLATPAGQASPVVLHREGLLLEGTLPPPSQPGLYRLTIAASIEGEELTGEYLFEVRRRDLEATAVLADDKLLKRLAEDTGGRAVRLGQLPDLLASLAETTRPQPQQARESRDLLAPLRWPIVLLGMALLCEEWILRKKRNLV